MKRFWLVLLSLGLVLAFSAQAFAVDVKFSGSFYAAGMYLDRTTLMDRTNGSDKVSTAFYYQRLRVQTDFIVSPGLKLVTRFDAMERAWGAARKEAAYGALSTASAKDSYGTIAENENIAFDWAYIEYASPIGTLSAGIMNDGSTGTIFGNSYAPAGRIKYSLPIGAFTINTAYTKSIDNSSTAKTPATTTDADSDKYGIEGVYAWKGGKAGINVNYYRKADKKPASNHYLAKYFLLTPYVIAKIGPVDIQAELNWASGKAKEYDSATLGNDQTMDQMSGWIDATVTFNPVYFGATFAYVSGDDPTTSDRKEGGDIDGGRDWNPTLIMFNYYDRYFWAGPLAGWDAASDVGTMGTTSSTTSTAPGAWFAQGRVGVKPIAALDIVASLSYAQADKKPLGVLNSTYGYEIDVTGTYKITNNLSYMMGVGYWFVGDYYKGSSNTNAVQNDYMLINKLTLTF